MKPAPPDPAELVHRMRQQLILVQVRIMELEDARDEIASRLAESQQLLRAAQTLADQKLDETAHLETIRADLLERFEQLRHVQHVTNEALNTTRAELAAEKQSAAGLEARLAQLTEAHGRLEAAHGHLAARLGDANAAASAHRQRIVELDAEVRAMKSSRSWRWMAWVRSLERRFGGKK